MTRRRRVGPFRPVPMNGRGLRGGRSGIGNPRSPVFDRCTHRRRQASGRHLQEIPPQRDHRLRHRRGHSRPRDRTGEDRSRDRHHPEHRDIHLLLPSRPGGAGHQGLLEGHSRSTLPGGRAVCDHLAAGVSGGHDRRPRRPAVEPRLYPGVGTRRSAVAVQSRRGRQGVDRRRVVSKSVSAFRSSRP